MKFAATILFAGLCAMTCIAQDLQPEINEQVWLPFIKTFGDGDTEGFMALHSRDVVRSPRDGKRVLNWEQYFEDVRRGNEHAVRSGYSLSLELRFTERIAQNNLAIEVGIYKTTYTTSEGQHNSYGRFHAVLRKEDGIWKILVDTDS